ncbi:winged helix-turn-helix transcriptional regulator [Streptomyces sp. NPDC087844]|uniref:winged helix-turn-helix transcriptional regulator n=1 Tax=Streptomyces sp. NPDC087844 TaxID=3365805 RepID=UPI0038070FCC
MTDDDAHCYELVADCRLRAAADLFAHTWDPVVLAALRSGPCRRRDLRAAIGGISDKVLTDTVRRLLANGLVDRRAHAEAPPRVEYALTGLGLSLVEGPMAALGRWVTEHGDELLEAQEAQEIQETQESQESREPWEPRTR